MPGTRDAASGRIVSAGATLLLGAGLVLYQLTSLVLGPASSRQLDLSLTVPAIELQDLSDPNALAVKLVVGTRATPAAPASHVTRAAAVARAASAPTPKPSSQPLPVPSPVAVEGQGGGSHPDGKKRPIDG